MFSRKISRLFVSISLILALSACGGGGKSADNNSGNSPLASSISSSQSSLAIQTLTRQNTSVIASGYLDLILFAKDSAASIVNGDYHTGLSDGTYKNNCEGGKGSYEITVSKNGDQLKQKYNNCETSITENGITEKLLVSGEESITITRNENAYSLVDVVWKNYSVSINGELADSLDGTLNYQGFLYFAQNTTYTNVISRIKINAKINSGGQVVSAENIELTYNYPSIFDSYPFPGGGFVTYPQGLHVFAGTIISAQGTLGIGDVKSNFLFAPEKQRVTFSNSATARSYLDTTNKGFYIRWDENNDSLIDATVFLSEDEYPVISEHLLDQTTNIYFARYPKDYGMPLPPNHFYEGQYKILSLSKGATTEIDVRELFTNKSGALLTYEIDKKSSSDDWEKIEAGRFTLKFPNSNGTETFNLKVTAVDIYNNRSPEITVTVRMNDNLADTDKDGLLDINDPDIDNDGITNHYDVFPKDPHESSDLDWDGIGDNSDPDSDNDEVANNNDAFPKDRTCHTASSGDEYGCYLNNARYAFDDGSIIYFMQQIDNEGQKKGRLIKFDTKTNQFLAASPIFDTNASYVSFRAYDPINKSVLMGDRLDKKLYLLKLGDLSITPVRDTSNEDAYPYFSENGYFAVGVTDTSGFSAKVWVEVFDRDGNLTDSNKEESLSNPNYFLAYNIQKSVSVPFCTFSITIGSNGKLISHGNPAEASEVCSGVNATSPNMQYTFPQPTTGYQPFKVYDVNANEVSQFDGYQMQWMNNLLVYVYIENNSKTVLAVSNIFNDELYSYKDTNSILGDIYVVGDKIISFQPTDYMRSLRLIVFDKELNTEFDSLTK